MRGATECARRLKLLLSSLRSQLGKVSPPAPSDPITQMLLGILSRNVPEPKAAEALDRLRSVVVDYNELRVIPPYETGEALGDFADARLKCEDIARALNSVFAREHQITLDHLKSMSKRDALAYLESTEGLEDYTIARVRQLGLEHHAIPLDEAMWAYAREQEIVNPKCSLKEAQQFLERQVSEEEGLEVTALLCKQAWSVFGNAVRKGAVERILSVPPDRTSRNMLQMISATSAVVDEADEAVVASVEAPAVVPGVSPAEEDVLPDEKSKPKRKAASTETKKKSPKRTKAAPPKSTTKKTKSKATPKSKTKKAATPKTKSKTKAKTKRTAKKTTKSKKATRKSKKTTKTRTKRPKSA